jgi:hypothetical protein
MVHHSSQPRATTLWPTTVLDTTTLDLPSINYWVFIIPKHPHYIHIITCIPKHFFFQQYYFPQHNHIYNIISCYSNHPSNIILSSQILNLIIHNTTTYIFFYQQFHSHKYIPMSSTSIFHYNFSNQYLTNSFTYIFMHISTLSYYHISIHNTNLMHSSISIHQHISYSQHKSHAILNINSTSCHHSQYNSHASFNIKLN